MYELTELRKSRAWQEIHDQGVEEGIQKGSQEGIQKGIEKGIEEGETEEVAELLDLSVHQVRRLARKSQPG